ncbi:unnamed protein product, partial [Meganyctiphanes norvegica]
RFVTMACGHSVPAPLARLSAQKIVDIVIEKCLPHNWPFPIHACLRKSLVQKENYEDEREEEQLDILPVKNRKSGDILDIDTVILLPEDEVEKITYMGVTVFSEKKDYERHLEAKRWIMIELKKLKDWWDGTSILGPLSSPLQREIRNLFYNTLQCMDGISLLYNFLLELIFSVKAGGDRPIKRPRRIHKVVGVNVLKVARGSSISFSKVLQTFKPFCLEEFNTLRLEFEDESVIEDIIKNSPYLKILKLYKSSVQTFKDTSVDSNDFLCVPEFTNLPLANCPLLEVIVLDTIQNESCFDRSLLKKSSQNSGALKSNKLSFPLLKHVNVHRSYKKNHIHILLHTYKDLEFIGPFDGLLDSIMMIPDFEQLNYNTGVANNETIVVDYEAVPREPCNLKTLVFKPAKKNRWFKELSVDNISKLVSLYPKANHLVFDHRKWKFEIESEMVDCIENVLSSLEGLSITCLTFLSDIYSGHYLPMYESVFYCIGPSIRELNIEVSKITCEELSKLINSCGNLETLKIGVVGYCTIKKQLLRLEILHKLSSLSFWFESAFEKSRGNMPMYKQFINDLNEYCAHPLIAAAPNITFLEIDIMEVKTVLEMSQKEQLKALDTLSIVGESFWFEEEVDGVDKKGFIVSGVADASVTSYVKSGNALGYLSLFKGARADDFSDDEDESNSESDESLENEYEDVSDSGDEDAGVESEDEENNEDDDYNTEDDDEDYSPPKLSKYKCDVIKLIESLPNLNTLILYLPNKYVKQFRDAFMRTALNVVNGGRQYPPMYAPYPLENPPPI